MVNYIFQLVAEALVICLLIIHLYKERKHDSAFEDSVLFELREISHHLETSSDSQNCFLNEFLDLSHSLKTHDKEN